MTPNQSPPQCFSKGCTVPLPQAGGHLPKESPSTALPGVSTIMPKFWSCLCPPGLLAGVWSSLAQCTPHPASYAHQPHQTKQGGIFHAWAGGRRVVASSAGHTELQGPISPSRLTPHQPLHWSEFGSVCSHLHSQLSPSPLSVWAQIPWKGQARTRTNCREQFRRLQLWISVPSCGLLAHLMERFGPLQCSPDLLWASAILSEAQGTTLE